MQKMLRPALWGALFFSSLLNQATHAQEPDPAAQEQVGEVLGKPIYRKGTVPPQTNYQPKDEQGRQLKYQSHVRQLFLVPVMAQFQKAHQAELAPTEKEIEFAVAYFTEQHQKRMKEQESSLREERQEIETKLAAATTEEDRKKLELRKKSIEMRSQPPPRFFAEFMLKNWKWQRYLYDNYGGGRALFQQGGTEAFDATRKWIEEREQTGDFKITDPELRTAFYEYWNPKNHGAFLSDDPKVIRETLVAPPWVVPTE